MTPSRILFRLAAVAAVAAVPVALAAPASAGVPNQTVMTMTAEGGDTVRLGKHVTVAFNDGYTIDGTHFDIWVCDDTTIQPVDGGPNNGTCNALTFWGRSSMANYDQQTTARTMSWLISTDDSVPGLVSVGGAPYLQADGDSIPMRTPDGGWCAYAGKYLITHDYDTAEGSHGGHSNFLQIASDCDTILPETGSSTAPFIATAVALLLGGAFVTTRRLRTA